MVIEIIYCWVLDFNKLTKRLLSNLPFTTYYYREKRKNTSQIFHLLYNDKI